MISCSHSKTEYGNESRPDRVLEADSFGARFAPSSTMYVPYA